MGPRFRNSALGSPAKGVGPCRRKSQAKRFMPTSVGIFSSGGVWSGHSGGVSASFFLRSSNVAPFCPTHPEIPVPQRPSARRAGSNKASRLWAGWRPPVAAARRIRASGSDRSSAAYRAPPRLSLASHWRRGVMLSRIQNERPCVATARSSFLTMRSWMGVCGRFSRSDCQWLPSSKET